MARKSGGVRFVSKPGASRVHLPTTPSGTSDSGYYDVETGSTIPRARPTTDDARVGKPAAKKRMPGIGVGGPGEPL
jgi:hypothetical protein